MSSVIAVDTETTGISVREGALPFYVSTCTDGGECRSWRWEVDPFTRRVIVNYKDVVDINKYLKDKTLVLHNWKFDARMLLAVGVDITNHPFEETLIASHINSSSESHGLKDLALKYLEYSDTDEKLLQQKVIKACYKADKLGWKLGYDSKGDRQTKWDYWVPKQMDPDDTSCETYADQDAERTILLWQMYKELLEELGFTKFYESEKELLKVIWKMEEKGISINTEKLEDTKEYLKEEVSKCIEECNKITRRRFGCNVDIDSTKELKRVLHSKNGFNLPVVKFTDKGNVSTDKEALNKLYEEVDENTDEEKFLHNLLFSRAYGAGVGYLEGYCRLCHRTPGDIWADLYPNLNQTGTRTCRCSSNNPNGQNISKKDIVEIAGEKFAIPKLRDVFSPRKGKVWYAIDYSQLELRLFAAISKEQSLIDRLNSGDDIFKFIASKLFKKQESEVLKSERQRVKNTTYATIYGATEAKINKTCGLANAYQVFCQEFPNVGEFMEDTIGSVTRTGYVYTLDGYRLDAPRYAAYKGLNYRIQGTAGRIAKNAMCNIAREEWFDWENIRMVFQVHDEIIIEVKQDHEYNTPHYIRRVMDCMMDAGLDMGVNTPVSCNRITLDWGHGQEVQVTDTEIFVE